MVIDQVATSSSPQLSSDGATCQGVVGPLLLLLLLVTSILINASLGAYCIALLTSFLTYIYLLDCVLILLLLLRAGYMHCQVVGMALEFLTTEVGEVGNPQMKIVAVRARPITGDWKLEVTSASVSLLSAKATVSLSSSLPFHQGPGPYMFQRTVTATFLHVDAASKWAVRCSFLARGTSRLLQYPLAAALFQMSWSSFRLHRPSSQNSPMTYSTPSAPQMPQARLLQLSPRSQVSRRF